MGKLMAPEVSSDIGNTNIAGKRIPCSKNWCFTLNNYDDADIDQLLSWFEGSKHLYLFQEEIGKSGNKHLQGTVKFTNKCRPMENKYNIKSIHWEKTRSIDNAIAYCSKADTRNGRIFTNIDPPLDLITPEHFYPWQKNLINLLKIEPDNRSIYWYWEKDGCAGKTAIAKYICANLRAIVVSGKSNDCKNAILQYHLKNSYYPKIIIFDIPRCNQNHISYEALESIKNGLFYSGKYEGGMCIFNSPHVICFANEEPDYSLLSVDRWVIINI